MPSVAKRRLAIAEVVVEEKIESVESAVAEVGADDGVEPMRETRPEELRLLEALLFASAEPLDEKTLAARLPQGVALKESVVPRKLSRAAIETLAIVAYHQPKTHTKNKKNHNNTTTKKTHDVLLE